MSKSKFPHYKITRHHSSKGWYATEDGKRITKTVKTEEELTEDLRKIAISRLKRYCKMAYGWKG